MHQVFIGAFLKHNTMRYLIIIFILASLSLAGQVTPCQIKNANLIFIERDYLKQVLAEKQKVIDLQDDIIIHDSLLVIDLTNIHLATVKNLHDTISGLKEEVIDKNCEVVVFCCFHFVVTLSCFVYGFFDSVGCLQTFVVFCFESV